jgi:hypothetical protein
MSRGTIVTLKRQDAIEAAHLSLQCRLGMADSLLLATAQAYEATPWTQDADAVLLSRSPCEMVTNVY